MKSLLQYDIQRISNELIKAEKYVSLIVNKRNELIDLLCDTETYTTAEDEISRSINYLQGFVHKQRGYIPAEKLQAACCYLPLNQPLYSFVLNVLSLSFVCENVYYRPPQKLWQLHRRLYDLIVLDRSAIQIETVSRSKFFEDYVKSAEIVVYIGRYENVLELSKRISNNVLLVYNGSALNPVVVTQSADISLCCEEIVNARLYNTGQDCMAPAAIMVHDDIAEKFIEKLIERLNMIRLGENDWNPSVIGSMISEDSFAENVEYVLSNAHFIVYGGFWDPDRFYIGPTIFLHNRYLGETQKAFYAPFFCIYQYACLQELSRYFSTESAECYKGYISIFGSDSDIDSLKFGESRLIVLNNETLFKHEDGNTEFGGYGEGCSFVMTEGEKKIHPILLLREIFEWRNKR